MFGWFQQWIKTQREKQQRQDALLYPKGILSRRAISLTHDEWSEIFQFDKKEARKRFFEEVDSGKIEPYHKPAENTKILDLLPESTRELFLDISSVYTDASGLRVSRESFSTEWFPGFIFLDSDEDECLLVKYHQDGIYVWMGLDPPGQTLDQEEPSYPTIFHYFLCQATRPEDEVLEDEE